MLFAAACEQSSTSEVIFGVDEDCIFINHYEQDGSDERSSLDADDGEVDLSGLYCLDTPATGDPSINTIEEAKDALKEG